MSGESGCILDVSGLARAFGAIKAVDDMSFAAERGHITSIIGPNGAGKSTLFNLISGDIPAHAGRVLFNGRDVTRLPVRKKAAMGIARSFQITNLFFALSVLENIRLAAQILAPFSESLRPVASSRRPLAKTEELLERFALTGKAHEPAGTLSHGERRRLEIALTLASEPELILLDEPTQGMSHADTAETAAMIRDLAKDHSILLIEHDIGLVMDLSDHVVVMHEGVKIADGPPATVREDKKVQDAYLGYA